MSMFQRSGLVRMSEGGRSSGYYSWSTHAAAPGEEERTAAQELRRQVWPQVADLLQDFGVYRTPLAPGTDYPEFNVVFEVGPGCSTLPPSHFVSKKVFKIAVPQFLSMLVNFARDKSFLECRSQCKPQVRKFKWP